MMYPQTWHRCFHGAGNLKTLKERHKLQAACEESTAHVKPILFTLSKHLRAPSRRSRCPSAHPPAPHSSTGRAAPQPRDNPRCRGTTQVAEGHPTVSRLLWRGRRGRSGRKVPLPALSEPTRQRRPRSGHGARQRDAAAGPHHPPRRREGGTAHPSEAEPALRPLPPPAVPPSGGGSGAAEGARRERHGGGGAAAGAAHQLCRGLRARGARQT